MIVWLWDATGPIVSAQGITDDEARALEATAALMRSGAACSARIEMARAHIGIRTLTSEYERVGRGWTARRNNDGRIRWTRFLS